MDDITKILCVDDEPNVLKAIKRLLMDSGYEIISADSATEGLSILNEENNIQIVIADSRMPGIDGIEFLKKVHETWPETMRIVLSGFADTSSVLAAINEGQIYKFIPKPWDDDALLTIIDQAVEEFHKRKMKTSSSKELQSLITELQKENDELKQVIEQLQNKRTSAGSA